MALLLPFLLAGCTGGPSCDRPNLTSAAVPPDVLAEDGLGDATVTLQVVDALTGEAIPQAAVGSYFPVIESREGGTVVFVVFVAWVEASDPVLRLVWMAARTDAAGFATIRAPFGAYLTFVVSADGYG